MNKGQKTRKKGMERQKAEKMREKAGKIEQSGARGLNTLNKWTAKEKSHWEVKGRAK